MKNNLFKFGVLLLSAFSLGACAAPSNSNNGNEDKPDDPKDDPIEEEKGWNMDENLKILTIGNSFSDDSMEYVANIALDLGVKNVQLGNLFIGGCSLSKHYNNAIKDLKAYEYRTNDGSGWKNRKGVSISEAIESEDWDYISLQQNSGDSGKASSYSPYLEDLIDFIINTADEHSKIVFNMTWAYQQNSTHQEFAKYNKDQMTMYKAIVNAVDEKVVSNSDISLVIPVGTAIQNARTSFIGDNLTRDGYHLNMDYGRYIAGLTFVKTLTELDITKVNYCPSNVDEDYKKVAIESANNAFLTPFEVTNSIYNKFPEFDYSNYHELDLGLTAFGYWNATEATNYNKIITGAGNSNQFYASRRLTKMDIPVGSVIELKEGFGYRPEAWTDDNRQTSRPELTSTRRVIVDEAWWSNYAYRAFNIFRQGKPSLVNDEEAPTALKIYVPNDAPVLYEEMNIEFIYDAFYDATQANYSTPITDNSSLSNKFFTTKRFTIDELPLGTIIKLESGWQYRPEAWVKDDKQTSRPPITTQEQTVITKSWWSNYTLRAFNIAKVGTPVLTNIDKTGVFKIFIPKK